MNSAKFMVCSLAATQLFDAITSLEEFDNKYWLAWHTDNPIDDYDMNKIEALIVAWKEYRQVMQTA